MEPCNTTNVWPSNFQCSFNLSWHPYFGLISFQLAMENLTGEKLIGREKYLGLVYFCISSVFLIRYFEKTNEIMLTSYLSLQGTWLCSFYSSLTWNVDLRTLDKTYHFKMLIWRIKRVLHCFWYHRLRVFGITSTSYLPKCQCSDARTQKIRSPTICYCWNIECHSRKNLRFSFQNEW